ncbi:MAG TPA: hypothetical protein VKU01_10130 [Bryobacteraceae bacterium]|nr:hypothetical protein [Bryobacteraceae bacterium]
MRRLGLRGIGMPLLSVACFVMWTVLVLQGQDVRAGRVEVAVGVSHGVLLKSDGTVWTWGTNDLGQLGRDGDVSRTPGQVPGLSGIRSVVADMYFTMALKADGSVWTWGGNQHGQVGNGSKNENASPVPTVVRGLPRIVAIAAGGKAAMALDLNGTVWAWGNGLASKPEPVQKLPKVIAIAAGDEHFIAVDAKGQVWVRGHHGIEEIDRGTSSDPQQVPGLSDIIAVAGGLECTFGLKKDGTVWAVGSRFWGDSPTDSSSNKKSALLNGLSDVKAISANGTNVFTLNGNGTVWTWQRKPVRVGTLTGIAAIAIGFNSAAVDTRGDVWTWGPFSTGSEDPKIVKITGAPIRPEKASPRKCVTWTGWSHDSDEQVELFGCETATHNFLQICGDPDNPDAPEKWKNINYRFGPENGPPDLMFPAHPESAPPLLFYSKEEGKGSDGRDIEVIRFSNGAYTYRVYFGYVTTRYPDGRLNFHSQLDGGVEVYDRNGKRLSRIACNGANLYPTDLSRSLPSDSKAADRR